MARDPDSQQCVEFRCIEKRKRSVKSHSTHTASWDWTVNAWTQHWMAYVRASRQRPSVGTRTIDKTRRKASNGRPHTRTATLHVLVLRYFQYSPQQADIPLSYAGECDTLCHCPAYDSDMQL